MQTLKTVYTPMRIQTTINELSGLEKREHMKYGRKSRVGARKGIGVKEVGANLIYFLKST